MINKLNIRLNTKLNIINSIIKILLLVVIMFTLVLGISLERRDIVNSGQMPITVKLREELQFPNIYLEEEIDWVNKLGVTLSEGATWKTILDTIALKYSYANIIVSNSALEKIFGYLLLPNHLNIYYVTNIGSLGTLKITMAGSYSSAVSAHLDFFFIEKYTHENYLFYLDYRSGNVSQWTIDRPIPLDFGDRNELPIIPKEGTQLLFNIFIYNIPVLNPVAQGKSITVGVDTVLKSTNVVGLYNADIKFVSSLHGKDDSTGAEYRIIYSGYTILEVQDTLDGGSVFRFSNQVNRLWIQIYVKRAGDDFYTMTHREEEIGTPNCHVRSIKLITN